MAVGGGTITAMAADEIVATRRWQRFFNRLCCAWVEGSVASDPLVYGHYRMAQGTMREQMMAPGLSSSLRAP